MELRIFCGILIHFVVAITGQAQPSPCGITPKRLITKGEFFNRIRGGWEARPHSIPWQVAINIETPTDANKTFFCGGTLVQREDLNGTDLVITAAHCLTADGWQYKFVKSEHIEVLVGVHDLTKVHRSKRYSVKNVMGHKWHDPDVISNDIALIQLDHVVPYTETTIPACLPKPNQPTPFGMTCVSSGWGVLSPRGKSPDRLHMQTVTILPSEYCPYSHDSRKELCTKGHGDTCQGDSGGPLVCEIDGQYTLFGITSYGNIECTNSMFASVPYFINWYRRNKNKFELAEQHLP